MPLLNDQIRSQLTEVFKKGLDDAVTLHFFTQKISALSVPALECDTCQEAGEILNEIAAISDKLKLETHDFMREADEARRLGVDKIPAVVMQGKNKGVLRYYGVPGGYEFGALVEDLVDLSRGTTRLTAATRTQLIELSSPVHIQVLVTPTCPYCPLAARLAHQMAVESSEVTADVVVVSEFPEVGDRYRVYGVPKVILNERQSFEGALPEAQFLSKVVEAASVIVPA